MPRVLDYSEIDKEPDYEAALAAYVASLQPAGPADVSGIRVHPSGPADVAGIKVTRQGPALPGGFAEVDRDLTPDETARTEARIAPSRGPSGAMAQPAAALSSMVPGASMPSRADEIDRAIAEGRDLTPYLTQPSADARPAPRQLPTGQGGPLAAPSPRPGPDARAEPTARPFDEALREAVYGTPDLDEARQRAAQPDESDEPLPDASMPLPPTPKPATPLGKTVQVGHAAKVDVPNTAIARSALSAPVAPGEGRPPPPAAQPPAPQEDRTTAALKAVVAGARPAQAPPGDVDLEAALRAASGRQFVASMARAGGAMIGRGQGAGYDALDRDADRPVAEFQARRALSEQDRQHAALQAAADAARGKEKFTEEMGRGELEVKRGELAVHQRAQAAKERKGAGATSEKDVQKLGKDTEGLARIKADVQLLEKLATSAAGADIPGAGVYDTRKPAFMQSQSDTDAYQATLRVAAELLHQQSGAAVTPSEAERFLESRGMGKGTTEQQFRSGAKALVRDLRAELAAKEAKYRPEVVKTLHQRGGVTDLPSGATATPRPPSPGMVRIRDPKTGRTGWARPGAIPAGAEVVNAS